MLLCIVNIRNPPRYNAYLVWFSCIFCIFNIPKFINEDFYVFFIRVIIFVDPRTLSVAIRLLKLSDINVYVLHLIYMLIYILL